MKNIKIFEDLFILYIVNNHFGNINYRKKILNIVLYSGDTVKVMTGVQHSFYAKNEGCIFEEASTTLHKNDSFYYDEKISSKKPHERKTKVSNWDRYELKNVS